MEMVVEEQNQCIISPNRMKFQEIFEEGKEDRISSLPDCLVLEVLSRLHCTKKAIRTGTLSKRWKHLWTLLPVLVFDWLRFKKEDQIRAMPDFVSFVDKTITQCRQLKLKKFQVNSSYQNIGFESQVNNWIRYAIRCNIEELDLSLGNSECPFRVDQFLFNSSCLTDLKLGGCLLNPTGAINWKNLRSLCLFDGKLDEDLIEKILLGSPLLETLEIHYYSDYQMLNITSKSLKKLVLCGWMEPDYIGFESQVNNWIRFAIRCNIEELELTLWTCKEHKADILLDQTFFISSSFTDLTLKGYMFNPTGSISWKNLMYLRISCVKIDEDLIENILRGSPQLETLVLNDCYGYRRLDITSKSVKSLVLFGYFNRDDAHIMEINAPNILSLTIEDSLFLWKLVNVSCLVKANLDYIKRGHYMTTYEEAEAEAQEEMLKGFILNLCHVTDLKIGLSCSGVVSRLEAKGFVIPSNVRLSTYYD